MALLRTNLNPTDRQLRQFGWLLPVVCAFAAWWLTASIDWVGSIVAIALALSLIGHFLPALIRPLFVGLVWMTLPISYVLGELVLLLIFFGLFFPLGVVLRVIGRDSLQRRSRRSETYWQPRKPTFKAETYFRQS